MSDDQATPPGSIPPPPGAVPPPPPPPPPPPMPPAPTAYEPMPEPPPSIMVKRGFAGRLGAGIIGLAVLGGGLAYAVSQSGSGGGGSSPEAAAQALFDAIAAEDVLGVLDVLPAGERRAFQGPLESMAEELGRLGVVGDDLDLGAVGGLDLEFEDLTFETEELGEGISSVRLSGGTAIASVKPGELPIGDELREVIEDVTGEPVEIEPVEEERDTIEPGEGDFEMVAVEEDGTWRISLFYSIAEAARTSAGLEAPDFGAGVEPAGAESPEAAVDALLRAAVEEQDLAAVIALLPPDEMAALQDYAPLFIDEAQAGLDEAAGDFSAEITDIELEATEDGDTASVAVTAFEVEATVDGRPMHASFDGECLAYEGPDGEAEEQCADDMAGLGALGDILRTDEAQMAGATAVRVDGEWYVSPSRTMLDSVVMLLESLEDDAISKLPSVMEGFFGMSEGFFQESAYSELGEIADALPDELDDAVAIDGPATQAMIPELQAPSIDVMTRMLVDLQGYTEEEAACAATAVFAAGLTDGQLSLLQTGEIPDEVADQVYDIIDTCLGFD